MNINSSNNNEEQFPLEDISKFNIYANYIPTTTTTTTTNITLGYENESKKDNLEQFYHTNYYLNENNERYLTHHHLHSLNSNSNNNNILTTNNQPLTQQQQNEYDVWYDHSNSGNLHNDIHKLSIDVTSNNILRSNLLKLLADGRIVLLSRIPILYRAKFGREFRDDIDCDGKIKLIEVFQALGSPFVLLGDGGNASVRRELPYHNTMNQYSHQYINQYQVGNNDFYRHHQQHHQHHHHHQQQQQQQHHHQIQQYQNNSYGTTSDLQPKYRHTSHTLTYHEAQTRLKNNLDILLDDGIEILISDIPAAYKARFGIEYRDGLEYKGKIKLHRLFQQYGHPYVLSGDGLDTTVRKVLYSHSNNSTNSRYLNNNNNNNTNQINSNWFPSNSNQTNRQVTSTTSSTNSSTSITHHNNNNNPSDINTSFIGLSQLGSYSFINQEIINSDISPTQSIRSSYFQTSPNNNINNVTNNINNSNINNITDNNNNNQNFSFSQIGSIESLENPPPLYEQQSTSSNEILSSFEYLNTSTFISDIRNDCYEVPPESPSNVYNEDMGVLANLPDDSLTLSRLPISNSSISTTSTVTMYPYYDTSAIPPPIIESPIKRSGSLQSRSDNFSRSVTPSQVYNTLNPIDYSKWSRESDLGSLGKLSCSVSHPTNCPCFPIHLNTDEPICIINLGQSLTGVPNTLKILLENFLISSNPYEILSTDSNEQEEEEQEQEQEEVDNGIKQENEELNQYDNDNIDNNNNNIDHKYCDETIVTTQNIPELISKFNEDLTNSKNQHDAFNPPLTFINNRQSLKTNVIDSNNCEAQVVSSIQSQINSLCTLSFYSNPQKLQVISDLPNLQNFYQHNNNNNDNNNLYLHGMKKIIILVSPTNYYQRKDLYEKQNPNSIVLPLIFEWSSLNLYQINRLIALTYLQNQGKVPSSFIDLLKNYQSQNKLMTFQEFIGNIMNNSDINFNDWSEKRVNFIKYFIDEFYFDINNDQFKHPFVSVNFNEVFQPGNFVLCDLTDPIYSQDESLSIFQLILNLFRSFEFYDKECKKLLVVDDAYKYLSRVSSSIHSTSNSSTSCSSFNSTTFHQMSSVINTNISLFDLTSYYVRQEFTFDIIDIIRHMKSENIQIILSTQSSFDIPLDIYEFSTITLIHHFQSQDNFEYLLHKLPLQLNHLNEIRRLDKNQVLLVTCTGITRLNEKIISDKSQHFNDSTNHNISPKYVHLVKVRNQIKVS